MKNYVLLLFALFSYSSIAYTQIEVQPYSITFENGRYYDFSSIGASIKLWAKTGVNNFVGLSPESQVTLVALPSGQELVSLNDSIKMIWEEESKRLFEQKNRRRFNAEIQNPQVIRPEFIQDGKTGFAFSVNTLAGPPKATEQLRLAGKIVYFTAGKDSSQMMLNLDKIAHLAQESEIIKQGKHQISIYNTGFIFKTKKGGRKTQYHIELDNSYVTAYSLDGINYEASLFLSDKQVTKKLKLYLKVVNVEKKEFDLDLDIIGLGM